MTKVWYRVCGSVKHKRSHSEAGHHRGVDWETNAFWAELGLPGVKKGKTWVRRHLCDTRNALVVLWRWFGAPSGMLAEDGSLAAQGSPVLACSGPYGAPGLQNLAQKAR